MTDNRKLEELSWNEIEQAVEQFVAVDGPNTDDLAADEIFALWAQFTQEGRQHIIEVQSEPEYSLEENLALLQQTSGILGSDLAADEVRYLVESAKLAEANIWIVPERDAVHSLIIR